MTEQTVIEIGRNALTVTLLVSGPMLAVALVVGLLISVFQAVTQINEATLAFVPKILAIFLALAVMGSWMIQTLLSYTSGLFDMLPQMVK